MATRGARIELTDGPPPEGSWIKVIHDCKTPDAAEVKRKRALAGSVWKCCCGQQYELGFKKDAPKWGTMEKETA